MSGLLNNIVILYFIHKKGVAYLLLMYTYLGYTVITHGRILSLLVNTKITFCLGNENNTDYKTTGFNGKHATSKI